MEPMRGVHDGRIYLDLTERMKWLFVNGSLHVHDAWFDPFTVHGYFNEFGHDVQHWFLRHDES